MNNLEESSKLGQVFKVICDHSVSLVVSWYPLTTKVIADRLDVSISTAQKRLKLLKEKDLIKNIHIMDIDEDGNKYTYSSYEVTKAGKHTKIYQEAYKEERQNCLDHFGIDIGDIDYE